MEENEPRSALAAESRMNRKEKRKAAKKEKRKQKRKELAEKDRWEDEVRLNDPEEQRQIQLEEEEERVRLERERKEFEERERLFLEALARKKAQEEEEEERRRVLSEEEQKLKEQDMEANGDEEWEYVEEGPPEIIWQGNEIIVKKNKVRVKKKSSDNRFLEKEGENRPTSNPLPPQSEAFADYSSASGRLSAQQLLENVAQQTPNFGTEQDKAHCPFHLKTGACRFGTRCSRVHFYPDKSCTLLIKNMYNGPGLAWEQDEGLEYTEEEVEHSFEEFYEDVHTEFLKFGEIMNFKVCRNGSHHLRGNVYVHYKSLESAMFAYHSISGRYFAGKQVNCEFVAVTRWKVAICGEYMKSNLKICSRGSACNFIHCFRNPGGDYEWADWDKPPPRFWVEKMAALFGYSDQSEYDKKIETPGQFRDCSKRLMRDRDRYYYRRSQSKEIESSNRSLSDAYEEDNVRRINIQHTNDDKRKLEVLDGRESREETWSRHLRQPSKKRFYDGDSDRDLLNRNRDADMYQSSTRKRSRYHQKELNDTQEACSIGCRNDAVLETDTSNRRKERYMREEHRKKSSRQHEDSEHKKISDSTDSRKAQSSEDWESLSCNDHWDKRSYDSDSTCELSEGITERCHNYGRKPLRHLNEASRLPDNYIVSHKVSSKESRGKKSEQFNSERCPVRKRSSSGRKYHLSRKNEVGSSDEQKLSDEEHAQKISSQNDRRRSKSCDSDISYGSSQMGPVEFKEDLPKKSKTKSVSDEKFGYDHTNQKNQHHDDSRESLNEDIDRRGRWEPAQVDSEKQQKHRRKSIGKNDKHNIGRASYDRSSDEYSKGSMPGGSSKLSHRKAETSSKEMDSDAKLEGRGEDGKICGRKYRSHGSKRRHKEIKP